MAWLCMAWLCIAAMGGVAAHLQHVRRKEILQN
jgi:hypothetical protein